MNKCFLIDKNKLHVLYEPIDDLDQFAKHCMRMLAEAEESEVYIIMDNSVDTINSTYIGVLMSCAMLSDQMGKKLHIKCNDNVKRLIDILNGRVLLEFID